MDRRSVKVRSSTDIINFRRMQEREKKRAQRRKNRENRELGHDNGVPSGWQVVHLNVGDGPAATQGAHAGAHAGLLNEATEQDEVLEDDLDNGERNMDGGGGDDDDGGGGDDDDGGGGDDDDGGGGDDDDGGGGDDDSGDDAREDGDDSGNEQEDGLRNIMEHMPPPLPDLQLSLGSWEFDERRLLNGDDNEAKTQIGSFLTKMACAPGVSKAALQEIYNFFVTGAEDIARLKSRHNMERQARTLREKTIKEKSPDVWTEVYRMGDTGLVLVDTVTLMRKELQTDETALMCSYISLKDLIGHVYRVHGIDIENVPELWKKVEINSDGIATAMSASAWDFHAISVRFIPCGTPYLWTLIQSNTSRGGTVGMESIYEPLVRELNTVAFIEVVRFALDSKERKRVLGMTSCNAYYSCTVCEEKGEAVPGDKKQRVSYPKKYNRSRARTRESIVRGSELYAIRRRDLPATRRNMSIAMWDAKGVLRRSPLLDLRNFKITKGTPGDFMHMIAIGIGRKIYRLLFMERHKHLEPGEDKEDVKERSKRQAKMVNRFVSSVRIPTELGRRTRKVVFARFKAKEWRYYCLFLYLYIGLYLLGEGDGTRKKILVLFTFMCRMFYLPDREYNKLRNESGLEPGMIMERLCKYYERSFGKGEMTFNEHLLFSHALEQREEHGPVSNYSVYRYEDLFGQIKNAFVKGTPNEAKQIFESMYTSDYFFHHCKDKKTINIDPKRTSKRDDGLVTKDGKFFRVLNAGDEIIRCREIQKIPLITPGVDIDDLPWSLIAVFEKGDERREVENIYRRDVDGKAVIVGNLLMSVGNSCLRE